MSELEKTTVSTETAGEQPVREQLKKASIDAQSEDQKNGFVDLVTDKEAHPEAIELEDAHTNGTAQTGTTTERGRLTRKRSFDDIETPEKQHAASSSHRRKRSRDSTTEDKTSVKSRTSVEEPRFSDDLPSSEANGVNDKRESDPSTPLSDKATETVPEDVASPKTKRSRLEGNKAVKEPEVTSIPVISSQPMPDAPESSDAGGNTSKAENTPVGSSTVTRGEKQDASSSGTFRTAYEADDEQQGFAPSNVIADTGATSTFGRLADTKSPSLQPQTSSTAFASSGFGALASSSSHGFGTLSKGGLSSFASPSKEEKAEISNDTTKPASSGGFGGTLGSTSAFASTGGSAFGGGSGFGKVTASGFGGGGSFGGGGFGGAAGSKLSSFAGPAGTTLGSSNKAVKAFGAPVEEVEEGSGDEKYDGDEAQLKSERDDEEKKDERFYAQDLETGEENETTEYTCRAKLYNFVKAADGEKKEWKERGLGTIRLNVTNPTEEELATDSAAPTKARLVMRAEGSHRVILNTPVKKELTFGTVSGEPPSGGYMYFMGSVDGQPKLELLQLKMRQQFALELYDRIAGLQEEM